MTRFFLALNALLFTGYGVYAFLNAHLLAANLGAGDMAAHGLYELRSNYGGVSVGAGLLCALGAVRPSLARPALIFLIAYSGGYALGRIAGLPIDGTPPPRLIAFGILEAVTAILAFALLKSQRSET